MNVPCLLAVCVVACLSGCGPSEAPVASPREPDANSIGFYCRMGVTEHEGPKGQILPKGWNDPLWFSSVRDALTYVEMEIVSEREIAGFWVNDMGAGGTWEKPAAGSWVLAYDAWYVLDSSKSSGMGGHEAVPFRRRVAAETFAREHGGRVTDYAEAKRSFSTSSPAESAGET